MLTLSLTILSIPLHSLACSSSFLRNVVPKISSSSYTRLRTQIVSKKYWFTVVPLTTILWTTFTRLPYVSIASVLIARVGKQTRDLLVKGS